MYQKYIKRMLDIFFSFILIIIFLPLMLLTSLVLYFSLEEFSFRENKFREGLNRKPYRMYKLRTKVPNSSLLPKEKRYTKISRIIDLLKLNELPQLFNVLRGEMSFVGPRPFLVEEILPSDKISEKRYLVRPGTTGLAQIVHGRVVTHKTKLKCDEIYYDTLSFWTDLKIVFGTPYLVIKDLFFYLKTKRK